MNFFDSHAHIDFEPLSEEKEAVVERAYKAGVTNIINVGASIRGSEASVEIAETFPNIYASVGIHPHEAEVAADIESAVEKLRNLANGDKVVAIGEIGLDYFVPQGEDRKVDRGKQKELFDAQLKLASELKKPVIIHTRDAEEDTLKILKSNIKNLNSNLGVVHCFTGKPDFVRQLLDLGFNIGFTGFVTFEQSKFDHVRDSAKIVPLEKMLIETDAPFLAPEPFRGKPNEPAYVVEVAKRIAEIKELTVEEVAEKTFQNAKNLFL